MSRFKNKDDATLAAVLGQFKTYFSMSSCPECGEVGLVKCIGNLSDVDALKSAMLQGVDYNEKVCVIAQAPSPANQIAEEVPISIREVLAELEEDMKRGRNAGRVLAGCRSVLDVSLQELGETQGTRGDRLERLGKNGILTTALTEWAKQLWKDGHDGVHELKADGHPIAEHIAFLKLFVEVAFVLPKKIEANKAGTN